MLLTADDFSELQRLTCSITGEDINNELLL